MRNILLKNKRAVDSKIRRHIISVLSHSSSFTRKMLVNEILARMGLTDEQINDTSVHSDGVWLRSQIGAIINEGIENKEIILKDEFLILKLNTIRISYVDIKKHFKSILENNVALSKQEIFEKCIKHFGADKTFSDKDDNVVRAYAGEILARSEKLGIISVVDGKYVLTSEKEEKINSYESFISAINSKGGEYFERYGAILIKKFYEKSGIIVKRCNVTGGSDDGGIDIELFTEDKLGFEEHIAVQAKARQNAHVTLKEVREFIGAMHTYGASRGIYLTTSYFHSEAVKLIEKVPNVTKIDGEKLYSLAKECNLLKI